MRIHKDKLNVLVRIYKLIDPLDNLKSVRYIGITTESIEKRLYRHIWSSKKNKRTHKDKWICKLLSEGRSPEIVLLQEVFGWDNACKIEVKLIDQYKSNGILTNSTLGGEGTVGYTISEEGRRNMSMARIGIPLSEEWKRKISKSRIGKIMSEESKEKMRQRVVSEELKERIRIGNLGKIRSQETRRKISKATTGPNNANFGKHKSEETKEKIRKTIIKTLLNKKNNLNE